MIIIFSFQLITNKNNFNLIIISGIISLFSTLQYILFNAPDVAITEASISVCLSSVFAIKFLNQFKEKQILEEENNIFFSRKSILIFFLVTSFFSLFFLSFYKLTQNEGLKIIEFGEFNQRIYNQSIIGYLEKTKNEIGIPNIVTALLAFFRGYDTFLETLVVLTAGIAVFFVLDNKENKKENDEKNKKESFIVQRICFFFIPFIILFGFYLQIHGEESPGGGFQAGAIISSSFILYAASTNEKRFYNFFSIKNLLRFGAFGVLIYLFVGLYPILIQMTSVSKIESNNLFLNYDQILCSKNLLNLDCIKSSRKLGIILIEAGVGICVFFVTLSLFLNLRLKNKL